MTTIEALKPRPAVKPQADTSKSTSRLSGLLGKVASLVRADHQERAASYGELISQIVACELDGKAELPASDHIKAILSAANKTTDDLAKAVETEVKRQELTVALAGESTATEALAEIKDELANHESNAEQIIVELQEKGNELTIELREREATVREFCRIRSELATIAGGPSAEEEALKEQLVTLQEEEFRTRARAGRTPLLERYITGKFEDCPAFKTLTDLSRECDGLAKVTAKQDGAGNTSEAFRLQKLLAKKETLGRKLLPEKQLYSLGEQVHRNREQRKKIAQKRDQLHADRLAMLG